VHLLVAAIVAFTPGIRTPSGNITCFVSHRVLHCELRAADYRTALRRRCRDLDWHGFELAAAEPAQVTCSGGILWDPRQGPPRYRTLAYGRTWRSGPFACASRRRGLTCTSRSGHALFLSRQSWSRR
jgi:hypothetical protein